MSKFIKLITPLLFVASSLYAQVSITDLQVVDSAGASRTRFSSTERIGFKISIQNTSEVSRINYRFLINGPDGSQVMKHEGNSSPGNIGTGGSAIRNIPLTFYAGPGDYLLKAEVIVDGSVVASSQNYFSIYSPRINLLYPADSSRDLIDKPLVFRWVSSGATKYEVKVSEDEGFYKTIWSGETPDDYISYPVSVLDERQKLIGGTVYFWSVTGRDSKGIQVAESSVFDFSMKKEASLDFSRNMSISDVYYNKSGIVPDNIIFSASVENNGSQAENDITVNLYINGRHFMQKKIPLIPAGSGVVLDFEVGKYTKESAIVSVVLDISDDDSRDNIITKTVIIPLPEEWRNIPKILGRIIDKTDGNAIEGVKIVYIGTKTGHVYTDKNGEFVIENLALGEYGITAELKGYETPENLVVNVNSEKAFYLEDIELQAEIAEDAEQTKYSLEQAYEIIKKYISSDILESLKGYKLRNIEVEPESDLNIILEKIKDGRAKVKNTELK